MGRILAELDGREGWLPPDPGDSVRVSLAAAPLLLGLLLLAAEGLLDASSVGRVG